MTSWTRASIDTLCGGPCRDGVISAGEAMLVIEVPGLQRRQFRCAKCAGSPAQPDLPAHVVTAKPARLESMARLWMLALDHVREPGEEG